MQGRKHRRRPPTAVSAPNSPPPQLSVQALTTPHARHHHQTSIRVKLFSTSHPDYPTIFNILPTQTTTRPSILPFLSTVPYRPPYTTTHPFYTS